MAVKLRGDSWQADFTHKGERFRKGGFDTRDEAERWMLDNKSAVLSGVKPANIREGNGKPATLETLKDMTVERYWSGTSGERTTVANAEQMVELLGPMTKPEDVTAADIDAAVVKLAKRGNSNATINRKLAALSKMMTFAYQRGYIPHKPRIERKRESTHRVRWYTKQEEDAILNTTRHYGYHQVADLFVFLLDTGARVGEALKVKWADIVMHGDGTATVMLAKRKGGTNSTIPLTDRLVKLFEQWDRKGTDGPWAGLKYDQVVRIWGIVRTNLGQDDDEQWVIHTCRHTFCSRLVQRGVPILTVKELAGHKTLAMTMRYAHLAPKQHADAIAVLN